MGFKFFASFLILLLAIFLQIYLGDITGIWINFSLAALITATFFLDLFGVIALTLFAVLILNWQPRLSWELMVFSAVPLVALEAKRFLPLQPWLNNLITIFFGAIIFYLTIDFHFPLQRFGVFAADLVAVLIFGLLAFGFERAASEGARIAA